MLGLVSSVPSEVMAEMTYFYVE